MAKEIERKYLVVDDSYKSMSTESHHIIQGYLSLKKEATVRLRIADDVAYITIKGINKGAIRNEWEYPIPIEDARELLQLASGTIIEKIRHIVHYGEHKWEVDEFGGNNVGLVVAEIELRAEDEQFPLPPFIGQEVTGDPNYYNSALAAK